MELTKARVCTTIGAAEMLWPNPIYEEVFNTFSSTKLSVVEIVY
jgi:hypothetical protein